MQSEAFTVLIGDCELCQAVRKTPRLYENSLCWAAPCETCQPDIIVVLKDHIKEPDNFTREYLADIAIEVANREFGKDNWFFDFERRKLPAHYHIHCRRKKF